MRELCQHPRIGYVTRMELLSFSIEVASLLPTLLGRTINLKHLRSECVTMYNLLPCLAEEDIFTPSSISVFAQVKKKEEQDLYVEMYSEVHAAIQDGNVPQASFASVTHFEVEAGPMFMQFSGLFDTVSPI